MSSSKQGNANPTNPKNDQGKAQGQQQQNQQKQPMHQGGQRQP